MQVSMRELKSHLSQYIEQAQAGQSIELTSYHKVVTCIVGAPSTDRTGLARLLTAGVANGKGGKPAGAILSCMRVASRCPQWYWKIADDFILRYFRFAETLHCRSR